MNDCSTCKHYYNCNSNNCDEGFEYENENRVWFNIEKFIAYMRNEFPEPMKYHFTYDLLQNTIEYLMEQFDDNTQLAYTISEIVPEVTEEEVLRFCAK